MGNSEDFDAFDGNWSSNVSKYMRAFHKKYRGSGKVVNPPEKQFNLNEEDLKTVKIFISKVNKKLRMPSKGELQSTGDYERGARKSRKEALDALLK